MTQNRKWRQLAQVITQGQVLLRINCMGVFKIFQNCPRREAMMAIWKILKTQVQLILKSTRTHAITCLSMKGKIYSKENNARSLFYLQWINKSSTGNHALS